MVNRPGAETRQRVLGIASARVQVARAIRNEYLEIVGDGVVRIVSIAQAARRVEIGRRLVDDRAVDRVSRNDRAQAGQGIPAGAAAVECDHEFARIALAIEKGELGR